MGEEEKIILPDGFKRVEYLQSNGPQWIDTGYVPSNNTGMYVKAQQNIHTNSHVMGSGADTNRPADGFIIPRLLKSTGNTCGFAWGGWTGWGTFGNGDVFESQLNYLNDKKAILRIGKDGSKTYSSNLEELPFTPVKPIYMFSTNISNAPALTWNGKIFEAKISEGLEVVKHFIPCLDVDNVPCMYDILGTGTIEENTYYNQGNGQFYYPRNYPSSNYNLPAGFKKCVYLQSDGTQWIDTGVIPDNETGLYFKALQLTYGNFVPFGVDEGNAIYPPRFNNKDLYYRWGASAIKMMTWDKAGDLIFHSSLNLYNSKLAKFDSEDTDVETGTTSQTGTYTLPIRLFSYNFHGSYSTDYGKWTGRIYRAQITQGDILIHDYVPCLDTDGRPCVYDLIGEEALYNQSGGTEFAYCVEHQLPSDFVKLKYLESTGTQYIKTGYVPTNTTGLYIDVQDVGSGDTIPMGLRESSSTNTRFFITRQTASASAGYGWGTWTEISTTKGSVRYDSTLNWLNDKKSITNNPLFVTAIRNLGELPFTPTLDIWMFGINQGGSHAYKFKGRIYRAKISEGSEIVRDFVPAYDTRKTRPCMYDLINNVAYYNDSTGEFLHNRDFEGTYKGYTGLSGIGNRLSGNCYHLVNALITDGNCRINLGKGIIDSNISHDFRGYTTDSNKFMFGTSNVGLDYFWQGDGRLVWGGHICNVASNLDVIVVVDDKNDKVRYNDTIVTKNANFVSNKQTSIFDVGRADTEIKYKPAAKGSKFYKWVMKKDGIIIHDYRPAIDIDFVPCVLDTITGEVFYNALSGTLTWE